MAAEKDKQVRLFQMMNTEICTHGVEGRVEASEASVVVPEGFLEEGTAGLNHEESQEAAGCVCGVRDP